MTRILCVAASFLIAAQVLTGCSKQSAGDQRPPATKISVVHASARNAALDYFIVDIYNGGSARLGTAQAYQTNTSYIDISSGNYGFIADTTSQTDDRYLLAYYVGLAAGGGNSIFIVDSSATQTRLVRTWEDLTPAGADSSGFRFLHFSPDAPKLNVVFTGTADTTVVNGQDFVYRQSANEVGTSSKFGRVLKGTHNISIRAVGTTVDLYTATVTLDGTKLYTLYASGFTAETGTGTQREFKAKLMSN